MQWFSKTTFEIQWIPPFTTAAFLCHYRRLPRTVAAALGWADDLGQHQVERIELDHFNGLSGAPKIGDMIFTRSRYPA
jgi:hypothetical protein